jgi:hypothetical protein
MMVVSFRQKTTDRPIHIQHEVPTSMEIPSLEYRTIACFFQMPGDPFRPRSVFAGVADEEIGACPFALCLVVGHARGSLFTATCSLLVSCV